MRGAAFLHALKIINLFVKRGEKRSPAELKRGIKPQPTISKQSIFGCRVFLKKREKEVSKLEPKALEGNFAAYTDDDTGYLVFISKVRVHARFRLRSSRIPTPVQYLTADTSDLLNESSQQLWI